MAVKRSLLPPPGPPIRPDVSLFIVNIVLLLILFFLAAGSLVEPAQEGLRLAQTRDLPISALPSPVLVVASDGSLQLDGTPVETAALPQALNGQTVLHLLMDRDAPALDLLALVNRPEMAGLDIRLVTLHQQSQP